MTHVENRKSYLPKFGSCLAKIAKREWFLAPAYLSSLIFFHFSQRLFADLSQPIWLATLFLWLIAMIIGSATNVMRHAEQLALKLGEPIGTLILTLSITLIEAFSLTAVILHGANNPVLVRDTLYSVIMIVMGGMVGTALIVGAIRHREQVFNLQGANAYLGVIIPLAIFSLVVPGLPLSAPNRSISGPEKLLVGGCAFGLYIVFLLMQTGRYRGFFNNPKGFRGAKNSRHCCHGNTAWHGFMLIAYLIPIVFLVEQLALPLDYLVETLGAPPAIGGVVMALLVTTPEGMTGVQAALENRLQQAVNIFLGSVLASIGLTVPIMMAVSSAFGFDMVLGLRTDDLVMLILILTISIVTFSAPRTHILQGAVHLVIFFGFILMLFHV
ncbi:calcium:proton antiporter [Martelella alba]|uniref:Calcium:proton antiporter n=1 Tax=Martelella alba TaxID=2590451 RepID=A0A506U3E7_9HYPH|nr:calcium:proton antiporter [Martelella alba]TPW27811.1 calcium:proton antiporter [Martelella alba]